MRELEPAWPPGTFDSSTSTSSPSDAPYTAAASPAGPAPTMTRSLTRVWSIGLVEAEAVGDLRVGRIPQHRVAAADQHRNVGGVDVKPIEQLLRVGIAIEIDVVERMAVARQELLDPQRAGAVRRADHDDVAEVARDQLEAAKDERAHQDLAQLGVGLHQARAAARD